MVNEVGAVRSAAATAEPGPDRRSKLLEAGLILVLVWTPLAFLPASTFIFIDAKFLVLLTGTLLIWLARPTPNRGISVAASVWVGTAVVASVVGADVWQSVAGQEWIGGGLILLVPCAYLLCVGGGIPPEITARIPGWLTMTALAVAGVYLLARFVPAVGDALFNGLNPATASSPLGHPIKLAAYMGVGIVASTAWHPKVPVIRYGAVAVLAVVLSLSTKRGGWVVLGIGLAVVAVRDPRSRRAAGKILMVVVAILLVLGIADAALSSSSTTPGAGSTDISGVDRMVDPTTASNVARLRAFPALIRAWTDRPVLGWGPANTYGAYASNQTLEVAEQGESGLVDAHDIVLESLVTTGALGFLALVALGLTTAIGWKGSPRHLTWSIGIALGLLAYHLVEPVSPSLTPLMFLLAGIGTTTDARERGSSLGHAVTGLALGALALMSFSLTASGIAGHIGATYGSYHALSVAHTLAPGRLEPLKQQARFYAVDSRSGGGDEVAAQKATAIAEELVRSHPWDPSVRYFAAGMGRLTNDPEATQYWLDEQVLWFPGDRGRLSDTVQETLSVESAP